MLKRSMKSRLSITVVLLVVLVCSAPRASAWGAKGHEMSARVAALSLPKDMPEFFRQAADRLAFLCPEPDRWITQSSPALRSASPPDHYFDLERWGADPLPGTRYELVFAAEKKGILKDNNVADLGTAPVAIAELAGKLVANFRHWRESGTETEAARLARHQIEENIIYNAGILAHYVTDLGNPLHCTVHHNGWAEGYPNPKGFLAAGRGTSLHARFESDFVERAINENDFAGLVRTFQRVGPWVPSIEQYVRRDNGYIDELYTLEQKGAFGSGNEPAESKSFTAARLADAATMLRDVWYTTWLVSEEEWLNDRVALFGRPGISALENLRTRHRIETQKNGDVEEVVAIGNRKNGLDGRTWKMYVNSQPATEAPGKHLVASGERVEFRFEKAAAAPK